MDGAYSTVTPVATRDSGYEGMRAREVDDRLPHTVYPQPSTYSYMLGNEILVHPVVYETNNTAIYVDMVFPDVNGQATTWLDWWQPHDAKQAQQGGGRSVRSAVPLRSYPVYVRQGAFLPLASYENQDEVLFTWFGPNAVASSVSASMRESASDGNGISAWGTYDAEAGTMQLKISAHRGAGGFEVIGVTEPSDVSFTPAKDSLCVKFYLGATNTLRVSCQNIATGVIVNVSGVSTTL